MAGKLVVVATPLGNLGDISRRASEALAAADVVACEDTRETSKLLASLGLAKPLMVYAGHNETAAATRIMAAIGRGEVVALVTDAGTPLVSDPGYAAVRRAAEEGVALDFIPGPSAVQAALVLSALPVYPYAFLGYLPARAAARRAFLERYALLDMTAVMFVSPHRLGRELEAVREVWGDRPAALARELTKKFQEVIRGPLSTIAGEATRRRLRGEMTLVVAGPGGATAGEGARARAVRMAQELATAGVAPARAAAAAAKAFNVSKKDVYLRLRNEGEGGPRRGRD